MAKQKALRRAGVDVSARWMDVSRDAADEAVAVRQCANTAAGQRELARWLTRGGRRAQVVLEATGLYSLDVALTLQRTAGIEVMVINPRANKEFAGAWGQRARSDASAAAVLRGAAGPGVSGESAGGTPFTLWAPPPPAALALRAIMRRVVALIEMRVQERNRLHALSATEALPPSVRADVRQHLGALGRQIARLECEARALVEPAPALRAGYRHLCSVKGIGRRSALLILSEVAVLPA